MRMSILVLLLLCAFGLANAGESRSAPQPPLGAVPPAAPIDFGAYKTPELARLVQLLRQYGRHEEAVSAGDAGLSRADLKPEEDAQVRWEMAQAYEFVPDGGSKARAKYAEVLKLHPDFKANIQIAGRLAVLHDSILLLGTKREPGQAKAYYEEVIRRSRQAGKLYGPTLSAQLCLGYLCGDDRNYDAAQAHFEFIYDANLEAIEPLPNLQFASAQERTRHLERLKADLRVLKDKTPEKLLGTCIRETFVDSLVALAKLRERHASDSKLVQLARETAAGLALREVDGAVERMGHMGL